MEDVLISLERDRLRDDSHSSSIKSTGGRKQLTSACTAFAKALHDLAIQFSEQSQTKEASLPTSTKHAAAKATVDNNVAVWLYNLSVTIPSPLDALSLANAILSACQSVDDMAVQSALFDTLGEGERAMEVLFDIMPRAAEISSQVTQQQLRTIHDGNSPSSGPSNYVPVQAMDPELEHLTFLRQQAFEAAEYASLLKAEVEGYPSTSGPSATTHTVKRASDKAATKRLKQAVKAAAAALTVAKEAGAIVDDSDFGVRGYDSSALASEAADQFNSGLHLMNDDEFMNLKSSLHAEGTKEYYEQKGLPKGTQREYFEGYEMVTIPAPFKDPAEVHERIVIADVMNSIESKAFAGTKSLNPMQSAVFQAAFHSAENLLICAPTGAGKTNVAMLSVVAHLRDKGIIKNEKDPYASYQHIREDQRASPVGRKIVYIAPMKALALEVVEKFSSKL
jgi:hypothetical protein